MNCALASAFAGMMPACSPMINVMGRSVPDSEYKASYDAEIAREKSGLKPSGAHDEYGRVPSWNEFWFTIAGPGATTPTAQSRRIKNYILKRRRSEGLPELTGVRD